MKSFELKQKLHHYIDTAQEKKLKAIYVMVEEEIETYNHWEDAAFVKEMNRRVKDFETGKTKGYTWDEVKKRAAKLINTKAHK